MQRGVLQLTREEVLALDTAFDWQNNSGSIFAPKLQYAKENLLDLNELFVSEEDLELLLDIIAPVDPSNIPLSSTFEKIGLLLRQFRAA